MNGDKFLKKTDRGDNLIRVYPDKTRCSAGFPKPPGPRLPRPGGKHGYHGNRDKPCKIYQKFKKNKIYLNLRRLQWFFYYYTPR